jgi:hypothetical protein
MATRATRPECVHLGPRRPDGLDTCRLHGAACSKLRRCGRAARWCQTCPDHAGKGAGGAVSPPSPGDCKRLGLPVAAPPDRDPGREWFGCGAGLHGGVTCGAWCGPKCHEYEPTGVPPRTPEPPPAPVPAAPPAPAAPGKLTAFDRIALLNLRRRPDRLAAFRDRQKTAGWRLPEPTVVHAIDGDKVGVPDFWVSGGGALGCRQSHIAVLQSAIMQDVGTLLVLEDDLEWTPETWPRLEAFLKAVPDDWEQLMLGGQHIGGNPAPVYPGVVRCKNCQRTHAYAVRGPAMKALLKLWYGCNRHIDHVMGPWQADRKVYAPDPFLFGQAAGRSDISGVRNPSKWWGPTPGPEPSPAPVVHLTCPESVAAKLRGLGLHTGYERAPGTGYDKGLVALAASKDPAAGLKRWLTILLWEAQTERATVAVRHPGVSAELVRRVHTGPVHEVSGDTLEDCLAKLKPLGVLRPNYAASHVVHLTADRATADALHARGWHRGNWRDPVTGQDNGLRAVAATPAGPQRAAKLAEWVAALSREADDLPDGVACCWHPGIGADELRAAAGGRAVVEVTAATADEALTRFREAVR